MDLALPARFGRYTLVERVGGGGMATVYRATLLAEGGFEKELAIKVVRPELASDPQFVEMFLDEARLTARLSHANIVQTFDFGQVDGTWFLAMEFVRGPTLAALLQICRTRGMRLGVARSLHVAAQVARGLGHAHKLTDDAGKSLGLVHRDVSPQNVLVSREGEVKLADFGIAKAAWRSTVTRPGHVRGKCAYMAPEQARGRELDARTDLFALGVVLWECLTGRPLFDGASDGEVLLQVVERPILPPSRFAPEVPPDLDALVLRLLARDPAMRPADGELAAREMAALLLRLVREPEETDLAAFLRGLSSGTALQPAVGAKGAEAGGQPGAEAPEPAAGGAPALGAVGSHPDGGTAVGRIGPESPTAGHRGIGAGDSAGDPDPSWFDAGAPTLVRRAPDGHGRREEGRSWSDPEAPTLDRAATAAPAVEPGARSEGDGRAGVARAADVPRAIQDGARAESGAGQRRGGRTVAAAALLAAALGAGVWWLVGSPQPGETPPAVAAVERSGAAPAPVEGIQPVAPEGEQVPPAVGADERPADWQALEEGTEPVARADEPRAAVVAAGAEAGPDMAHGNRPGPSGAEGEPAEGVEASVLGEEAPEAAPALAEPAAWERGEAPPPRPAEAARGSQAAPAELRTRRAEPPERRALASVAKGGRDPTRAAAPRPSPASVTGAPDGGEGRSGSSERQTEASAAAVAGRGTSAEQGRGRLVLSSRFSGPVLARVDAGPSVPLSMLPVELELPAGSHRVVVSVGTTGMRCSVRLDVQRNGKTALLVSDRGELLSLDGSGATPLACAD